MTLTKEEMREYQRKRRKDLLAREELPKLKTKDVMLGTTSAPTSYVDVTTTPEFIALQKQLGEANDAADLLRVELEAAYGEIAVLKRQLAERPRHEIASRPADDVRVPPLGPVLHAPRELGSLLKKKEKE